jgi:hypothetical protein
MMQLIYRGSVYTYSSATRPSGGTISDRPVAINWRYRTTEAPAPSAVHNISSPRSTALNWRYQLAMGK